MAEADHRAGAALGPDRRGPRRGRGLSEATGVDSPREVVVRDAETGRQRWSRAIGDDDQVSFGRDVAVLLDDAGERLVGLRMSDGAQVWATDSPRDSAENAPTVLLRVETSAAANGPAFADGTPRDPWRGADDRLVQIGADRSARLLDRNTGQVLRELAGGGRPVRPGGAPGTTGCTWSTTPAAGTGCSPTT